MVSIGQVSNDASIILTFFNQYGLSINEIQDNSIWQGASKDNAYNKAQEFLESFKDPISNQFENLSTALTLLTKFKELKKEKEELSLSLSTASDDEKAGINADIESKETMKQELANQIESCINNIMEVKLADLSEYNEASLSGNLLSSNGALSDNLMSVAADIKKYYHDNNVSYSLSNLCWGDIEKSMKLKHTCCATYVSEILYKSGAVSEKEINSINYNLSSDLYNHFKDKWQVINSSNDLQAGDVVFMYNGSVDKSAGIQHVQMYAGNNKWYNAGGNASIREDQSDGWNANRFYVALRPNK